MTTPDYIRAHRHSSNHRSEIMASAICGCFYCLETYPPAIIDEWVDEWENVGQTALCPRCGIDSVIGEACGYPITADFLRQMHNHWFGSSDVP